MTRRFLTKKSIVFLLTGFALLLSTQTGSNAQQIDYQIIVHPSNPSTQISKSRVSQLLLKKVSRWEHGVSASPVDLDSKSPVRERLSRDVHGRSVSSIKSYWQRQIFSGREVPPPEYSNESQVIQFVSNNPGSIGYVSAGARLDSVKSLSVSE